MRFSANFMGTVSAKIFKAYDIRGVYPDEISADLFFRIAQVFAIMMKNENSGKERLTCVVGRDMRESSVELTEAVIKGLTDQGMDVVFVGLVSTPTFYFSVAYYGYDAGIMISASHNPKQYNGMKFTRRNGVPVSGETGIAQISEMVRSEKVFEPVFPKGTVSERKGVLDDLVSDMLNRTSLDTIKPFHVVADTANGMGGLDLDALFAKLPCKLTKMNFTLDGTFPAHEADPLKEENLIALKQAVLENKADLGIATDGDCDRIFFVDDKGNTLDPAILRGILAQIFLREKPGAKIGYDIRPGKITQDMIEEAGGEAIVMRVGHSLIKEHAIKVGAYFAGESSGHFFIDLGYGFFEAPVLIVLRFLQELTSVGIPLSQWIERYKKYFHSGEINSHVIDKQGKIAQLQSHYADAQINSLDGITIEYPDWWFNARASNTEDTLRLNLEARTQKLMEEKRDEVIKIIRM